MSLNVYYVSASGTADAQGSYDNPMSLAAAVNAGGANSVIVLLNDAGVIQTEGVALFHNQFLLGAGATAEVVHSDGVTREIFTAPGSGGAVVNGTSKYNGVIGTHPDNETSVIAGISATGGVNNAGIIAETRYQFVLSGQSNMAGWEDVKDFDPQLQQVQEDVKIWTGSSFASLTPTVNTNPLEYGAAPSSTWAGSELSLGANLTQALGTEVYLTKVTAGGTSINRWLTGDMLTKVFTNTLLASESIAESGYAPFIGGVGWVQGEADYGAHSDYDQKLLSLLAKIQTELGISDLKMVVSGTSPYAGGVAIEEEQQQAASQSDFIETFSMQHFQAYSNGSVHFDAEGYSYMGYQFAVKFLENLMGNPVAQEEVTGYIPLWLRPVAPLAEDDYLTFIPGITEGTGNVLDNDSDFNPETFKVTAVASQSEAVGEWVELAEGGKVKIMADGSYVFDDMQAWENLAFGESATVTLTYTITDESGLSSEAQLAITIIGKGQEGDFTVIAGDERNNNLSGTAGNDVIYGYEGNDVIYGSGGRDIIFAGAGHDVIYSDSKNGNGDPLAKYVIFAEEGNDTVYGSAGDDIVDLGEGNNTALTYGGNDRITAGSGNDTIYAYSSDRRADVGSTKIIHSGDGNDTIITSDSDDVIITGNGTNVIQAGGGTDTIKTGDGNKNITAYSSNRNNDAGLIKTIITGNGQDSITTSLSDDKIMTGNGNKTILTYGGNDTVITGDGNNHIDTASRRTDGQKTTVKIITGAGNDNIYTSASNDIIDAGGGNNTIYSYGGDDIITTGSGNDNIYAYSNDRANDKGLTKIIDSGDGQDVIYTSTSDDIITAGKGNKTIYTYGGNDSIAVGNGTHHINTGYSSSSGQGESVSIITGVGDDVIYTSRSEDLIISGDGNKTIYTYGGNDRITVGNGTHYINTGYNTASGAEEKVSITTGDGNSNIYTSRSDDNILSGDGNKTIYTYGGNDSITVGNGTHNINTGYNSSSGVGETISVKTGDGNSTIFTSRSDDNIISGDGNKTIYTYGGNDSITVGNGTHNINTGYNSASGIGETVSVTTGDGNSVIYTSRSDDNIVAGDGNKTIYTYGGNDSITVGDGTHTINTGYNSISGAGENVSITTGDGNSTIYTSRSDDLIITGDGNDTIYTYGGNDIIHSGAGNDRIYAYDSQSIYDQDKEKFIDAGSGNDTVYGSHGKDTVIGGTGDDNIYLYSGEDIILFGANDGKDIIRGFDVTEDRISFVGSGLSADDITIKASGSSTIIYYNDSSITLQNVNITKMTDDLISF